MKKTIALILGISLGCSNLPLIKKNQEHIYLDCFNKVSKIKYEKDEFHDIGGDYWQKPIETLKRKKGDCEDMSFLLHYLLKEKELNSKVVFGMGNVYNFENHMWVEHNTGKQVLILDSSNKKIFKKSEIEKQNPRYLYIENNELNEKIKNFIENYLKK